MRNLMMTGAALAALAACATNDAGLDEMAAKAAPEFTLDYERFVLDNGLEVVLQRDASDPIVAVTTVVHAGSNRERPGRTGFAHFFEHMAFNDSENVPVGANRRDIPAWGGSRNGGTWSDGTIYYETVPKDAFEKILWIDSDRLGYMINTVTTAALEREKQVVKNEKRQRVDNAPYGYTGEVIRTALYPEGHPYSWTVIGQLPDLQAATLTDLREFYDRYYGAGNATLAIVGDIDVAETKEAVRYWFGEIRPGPDVTPPAARPVTLAETKRLSFEDNFATLPELRMTFPTPQAFHPDETALDVLAQLLAGSKASPLYEQVVVEAELAPSVSAYHNAMEIAGEFVVRVRAEAGTDLDEVADAVTAAMDDFAANGVDLGDLARIKAEQETALYGELSTALGKSQSFASNNEFAGDPGYAVKQADAIRAVDADDVMRVFRQYVYERPAVVTSFVPKGRMDLALAGSEPASVFIEEVRADVASEAVSQGEEATYEKTPTVADRSEPAFGELPLSVTPDHYDVGLADGVRLLGTRTDETPLVAFDIVFEGGGATDDQPGMSEILARLMEEGTALRTPAEIEQALGLLGASMRVRATDDEVALSGATLRRNLGPTLAIIEEVLTQPRFEAPEIERVKAAVLTDVEGRRANPRAVASDIFYQALYGEDHPLGRPFAEAAGTVAALTADELRARHDRLGERGVRIHVAGPVDEGAARDAFGPIADAFAGGEPAPFAASAPGLDAGGTVYFVDVPGSKQSVLMVGQLAAAGGTPEHELLGFANEKLGGGIGGDLAQTLRIELGYTYGAYSYVVGGRAIQPWMIQTSVRANATGPSLDVIEGMLTAYPAEFGEAEAGITKNKVIKDAARAQESLNAKLGLLREKSKYALPDTFVEDRQARLLDLSPDALATAAGEVMDPGDLVWVVVGDAETQLEAVRDFANGLPDGRLVQVDRAAGAPSGD